MLDEDGEENKKKKKERVEEWTGACAAAPSFSLFFFYGRVSFFRRATRAAHSCGVPCFPEREAQPEVEFSVTGSRVSVAFAFTFLKNGKK